MSLIQPQTKAPAKEQFTIRLEKDVAQTLRKYCEFIDSTQDYVLNQALRLTFEKDKAFQAWLAEHPAIAGQPDGESQEGPKRTRRAKA
jgi:predicted transcriptional regulator